MPLEVTVVKAVNTIFKNYSYIIHDPISGEGAIVDPAGDITPLREILTRLKIELKYILLTHAHLDHTEFAAALAVEKGARVIISKEEASYYDFHCPGLNPVKEGSSLGIGESVITPLLTPGHTKGSFCYLIEDHLFTGDTLFIEGCGICWTNGGDPGAMFDSLQRLKQTIPGGTRIWPGHSYGFEPGCSFRKLFETNIYLDFSDKEKFIEFRMRKNQKTIFNFQ